VLTQQKSMGPSRRVRAVVPRRSGSGSVGGEQGDTGAAPPAGPREGATPLRSRPGNFFLACRYAFDPGASRPKARGAANAFPPWCVRGFLPWGWTLLAAGRQRDVFQTGTVRGFSGATKLGAENWKTKAERRVRRRFGRGLVCRFATGVSRPLGLEHTLGALRCWEDCRQAKWQAAVELGGPGQGSAQSPAEGILRLRSNSDRLGASGRRGGVLPKEWADLNGAPFDQESGESGGLARAGSGIVMSHPQSHFRQCGEPG